MHTWIISCAEAKNQLQTSFSDIGITTERITDNCPPPNFIVNTFSYSNLLIERIVESQLQGIRREIKNWYKKKNISCIDYRNTHI